MSINLFTRREKGGGLWLKAAPEENRDVTRIAVCAASPGAGASFISGLLASAMAAEHRVTLVELGKPYFYTALGMEKRFASRPFAFYCSMIDDGKSLKSVYNVGESINWAVKHPRDSVQLEPAKLFRCFTNIPGEVIIFDCSGMESSLSLSVLAEADCKVVVVDPMPTSLFRAFDFLEDLRLRFSDAVFVVNKMNDGVHRGELNRFLGKKELVIIPFVTPDLLYQAEYNSMLPASVREVNEELKEYVECLKKKITKKTLN